MTLTRISRIATFALLTVALASPARAEDSDKEKMKGLKIPVKAGVNFNAGSNASSDLRVTFAGGAGAEYFFHHVIGVYVGADYMNRGYKNVGVSSSSSFVDIDFGIAFQYRGGFGGDSLNTLKLGGYYAVPIGDLTGNYPFVTVQQTKAFFGIGLEGSTLFPLSEGFSLGVTSWFKYGLESALKPGDSKFLDFGLGLAARFL